jgi:hypothetical protein
LKSHRAPREFFPKESFDPRSERPTPASLRDNSMSINSEQTFFHAARLIAASAITPAIRLRIWRFASAGRRSRILWREWEASVRAVLTHPLIWTLVALLVSSVGLYWDLR